MSGIKAFGVGLRGLRSFELRVEEGEGTSRFHEINKYALMAHGCISPKSPYGLWLHLT